MNWSFFLNALLHAALLQKGKIAILGLITIILTVVYIYVEAPSYKTSWIVLLPGTERTSTINFDNLGEARSSGKNAYGSVSISPKNTYKEIALSNAVIQRAAKEYGVTAAAFSKPRIKLVDQTPAMEFTLKGASFDDLKLRAELFNKTFHSILDQLRKNEIERHYQGIEGNLSEAKLRLQKARQAITDYQAQSSLVSEDQFKAWLTGAETIRAKKDEAKVSLAALEARLGSQLSQMQIDKEQVRELFLIHANPANQVILDKLAEYQVELASVAGVYGAQNPIRIQLEKQIAGVQIALLANLGKASGLTEVRKEIITGLLAQTTGKSIEQTNNTITEIESMSAQLRELTLHHQAYVERIKSHASEAGDLTDLNRDHQIAEAIFSSALAKLDTSKLDIYATYPLTQLLTQPGATIKRDRLQTKLTIIAIFMAFGLIALTLILQKMRQQALRDSDDPFDPDSVSGEDESDLFDGSLEYRQ